MLSMFLGKSQADVRIFKFPTGESGVSFKSDEDSLNCLKGCITLRWEGNDDLINLALLVDAVLREYKKAELSLKIPYFPYARQDRVCNAGESLSVKVVADFINSLNFARVFVTNPHSDVLGAVLNNMIVPDEYLKVAECVKLLGENTILVSPDAGANKRVLGYAKTLGGLRVIRSDKTRDTKTGYITDTVVYSEHVGECPVLVVDDILDGGGTFIPLAGELRKITNGSVNLLISHGCFTKGVDIFEGVYDNLFVVNNMYGPHKLIKEIKQ